MKLRRRVAATEAVRELVDSAFAARYHDLATMLKLSSAAVALAEERCNELPSNLIAAAWTQYGNALRIAGRYPESERALKRAADLPISDEPTRIHLLEVTASLHRNTGRFESAAGFLTTAISSLQSIGDSEGEARTQNLLGIVLLDAGERSRALQAFKRALDLVTESTEVDVVTLAGHNLFETLIAEGRLAAASAALVLLEPLYRRFTSARMSAKAEWMRAKLCRAMNQLPAAKLAYERAYALLSTEPRSPELAELAKEMAEI